MQMTNEQEKTGNDRASHWYVIQVATNRELFIKRFIEVNSEEPLKTIVFTRELLFKRKGKEKKVINSLFPGYIFIYKNVKQALEILQSRLSNEFIRPICFKENKCIVCFDKFSPCMVRCDEIKLLLNNSDQSGLFKLSKYIVRGDDVIIEEGPLKALNGKIIWLNTKKSTACIEISLFKRLMKVNLGIELLKHHDRMSNKHAIHV